MPATQDLWTRLLAAAERGRDVHLTAEEVRQLVAATRETLTAQQWFARMDAQLSKGAE